MTNQNYTNLSNMDLMKKFNNLNITGKLLPSSVQKLCPKLFIEICNRTNFLNTFYEERNKNVPIQARLYCIANNIHEHPKCQRPGCQRLVNWRAKIHSFAPHCCQSCAQLDPNVKSKIRQTNIERYGCENVFQNDDIKKCIRNQIHKRYGVDNPSQSKEILQRKRDTWINNYGVDHPLKSKTIMNSIQRTNQKRYGGNAPMCSETIREKMRNTCIERYGGIGFASKELNEKSVSKTIELYGKTPIQIGHEAASLITKSKPEIELGEYVKSIYIGNVQFNTRSILSEGKELDIWISEKKIAIEFNGDYWHMNPKLYSKSDYNSNLKMTANEKWEYDKLKYDECCSLGIELIVIWEYDWNHNKESIKNMIFNKLSEPH